MVQDTKNSSPEERRRFLEEWARQNPDQTVDKATQALLETFGKAINRKAISDIIRDTRRSLLYRRSATERIDGPPEPSRTVDAPLQLKQIAEQLRKAGIRKLEIREDGTVTFDLF